MLRSIQPLGVRLSWVARRTPGLEVTLRDVEVCAADPAASHSDEDFARHRLRKRKFGELERVIIDRPFGGQLATLPSRRLRGSLAVFALGL